MALVDTLSAMNIRPDGIIGHSVGELGCGYADGSLTARETVIAAYWRGRCIVEAELEPGAMAAVGEVHNLGVTVTHLDEFDYGYSAPFVRPHVGGGQDKVSSWSCPRMSQCLGHCHYIGPGRRGQGLREAAEG